MTKIGVDAEFFLKTQDNKLVSAIGKIPGTKAKQHKLHSGAGLHHDNVSLELAFLPFNNFQDFNNHIEDTFQEVKEFIHPLTLSTRASAMFPEEELDCKKAWEFGCDPDMDAWTGDFRKIPTPFSKYFRCNGAHVHFGIKKLSTDFENHFNFIKYCDATLGVWSAMEDKDQDRKKLYGTAGAFRPKSYGLEYRVLSNFWIFSKELRERVFNMAQDIGRVYKTKQIPAVEDFVRDMINGDA